MKKCLVCGNDFDALSEEHIIPNCICGRIKSYNLLCETCNSTLGHDIDNALDGVYSHIINMFGIKRERGESQPVKVKEMKTGTIYQYLYDGSYELANVCCDIEKLDNGGFALKFQANPNDRKRIKNELGKQLAILKNELKNIGIDYKKEIKKLQTEVDKNWSNIAKNKYTDRPGLFGINLKLGGKGVALAILKICYLFLKEVKPQIMVEDEKIVNILKTKSDDIWKRCYTYSLNIELFNIIPDEISHFIYIKGYKKDKKIVAYIQLFSLSPYICILNNNYNGEDFIVSYGYNLLSQMPFSPVCNELESFDNLEEDIGYKKHYEEYWSRIKINVNRIRNLYYKLHPKSLWSKLQISVYRKLIEIVGERIANSPRVLSYIDFIELANQQCNINSSSAIYDEKVINNLADSIIGFLILELNNKCNQEEQ